MKTMKTTLFVTGLLLAGCGGSGGGDSSSNKFSGLWSGNMLFRSESSTCTQDVVSIPFLSEELNLNINQNDTVVVFDNISTGNTYTGTLVNEGIQAVGNRPPVDAGNGCTYRWTVSIGENESSTTGIIMGEALTFECSDGYACYYVWRGDGVKL
jgi:hypothetical protein